MAASYTSTKKSGGGFDCFAVAITTASDGTCTAYTAEQIFGIVLAVCYVKTDFANGVDFTITGETTGASLWTDTDVNASENVYPRVVENLGTTGAAQTTLTLIPLAGERVKFAIAQGGDTKSGTFYVIVKR